MTTDDTLLAGLRAGDAGAARALYDSYGASVYGFARRRTGDAGLSSEIVQDVMLRVWQKAPSFDAGRGSFRSWIFQIARNATIDAGRRQRSRPRLAEDVIHLEPSGQHDDIEVMFRNWLIAEALDRLPDDHRAVVELVYFRGLKVAEAAERLGIAEGTVKSRCFYALKNLRSTFDERGVMRGEL